LRFPQSSDEFQIGVSEPEKVGEGMNQYSLYTITVKVRYFPTVAIVPYVLTSPLPSLSRLPIQITLRVNLPSLEDSLILSG